MKLVRNLLESWLQTKVNDFNKQVFVRDKWLKKSLFAKMFRWS